MKRLLRKSLLRYSFFLTLFVFLISVFVLSLKDIEQTKTDNNLQSVTTESSVFKFKRIALKHRQRDNEEKNTKGRNWKNGPFPPRVKKEIDSLDAPLLAPGIVMGKPETAREDKPLDVFIFEEHHEAIPYWFGAAYDGSIPQTGNTLIHIDGHSDMAPPMYFHSYPFFRWPAKSEIKLLMQRNDAFIQASIMAGLINRMIWVWPEWDRVNHEADYEMFSVQVGWTMANVSDSPYLHKTFCMCQKSEEKVECIYPSDSEEKGVEEVYIKPEDCHTKKVVLVENIHELKAIEFLKQNDWINESESILLDIDEDFFGCSYVIKPLLDTNISIDTIREIEENLRRIICPKSTFQETQTNKIILKILSLMIRQKSCQAEIEDTTKCKDSNLNLKPEVHLIDLLTNAFKLKETNICVYNGRQIKIQIFVKRFVKGLSRLTIEQLRIIHQIGFCSTTTPKTLHYFGPPEFGLCYGANTPLETAVVEFNPTAGDIKKRSGILRDIIQNMRQYSPQFVTLCRSVRDGYTPRQFFSTIENEILTTLEKTFRNVNLTYDRDLLDGKEGRILKPDL